MYALETIHALEREAFETAKLARAIQSDVEDLIQRLRDEPITFRELVEADRCTNPDCIDGYLVAYTSDSDDSLALVRCPNTTDRDRADDDHDRRHSHDR